MYLLLFFVIYYYVSFFPFQCFNLFHFRDTRVFLSPGVSRLSYRTFIIFTLLQTCLGWWDMKDETDGAWGVDGRDEKLI
jgi:hypothetical protein